MLFAGLGSSTQGCKLIVLDFAARQVIHLDTVNYDTDLKYGTRDGVIQGLEAGASESDPRIWIEAIELLFSRMRGAGVLVEGEGAAMGAALHAAWVYEKENGREVALADLVQPFIQLREAMRIKPNPAHLDLYRPMKKAFFALSARVRGIAGAEDPFLWRRRMQIPS